MKLILQYNVNNLIFSFGRGSFTLASMKFTSSNANFHTINIKFETMNKCLVNALLTINCNWLYLMVDSRLLFLLFTFSACWITKHLLCATLFRTFRFSKNKNPYALANHEVIFIYLVLFSHLPIHLPSRSVSGKNASPHPLHS